MAAALANGRQRQLLADAQAVAAALKELPHTSACDEQQRQGALAKVAELARLVRRLHTATAVLEDDAARTMWEQRGMWMQQELIELVAERLQGGDPAQYWSNLAALLYAGAEGHERALLSRAELEEEVKQLQSALEAERRSVTDLQQRIDSHSCTSTTTNEGATIEEILELRTKLAVAQQELQRQSSSSRDIVKQHEAWQAERETLRQRVEELTREAEHRAGEEARQSEVITTLMEESEATHKRMAAADTARLEASHHNHTLSVNLENHARVVEKLIELNTELMDDANRRAFGRGGGDGCPPLPPSTSAPSPCEEDPPSVAVEVREAREGKQPREYSSLSTALESFLTDDFEPPRQASASSLEVPAPVSAAGGGEGAGRGVGAGRREGGAGRLKQLASRYGGVLSRAAAFVAGNDKTAGDSSGHGLPV